MDLENVRGHCTAIRGSTSMAAHMLATKFHFFKYPLGSVEKNLIKILSSSEITGALLLLCILYGFKHCAFGPLTTIGERQG